MPSLTKLELDLATAGGCQSPGCKDPHCKGELVLNQRCHPGRGVNVSYFHGSGEVRVECRVCKLTVAIFKVAET